MNTFTTFVLFGVVFYLLTITMACPPCIPANKLDYYKAKGDCLNVAVCQAAVKRKQGNNMKRSANQCPPCIPYYLRSHYKSCPERPICAKKSWGEGKVKRSAEKCPPCIPYYLRSHYKSCPESPTCAKKSGGEGKVKRSARDCPPCIPFSEIDQYRV